MHLSEVHTELTTAQAHENWQFAQFKSETQTVRVHFNSPQAYEHGTATHITGAKGIELAIGSFAAMREARCLVSRCTGIVEAKLTGRPYMNHEWPSQLRSASLERLIFDDLLLPDLDMPSLLHLSSVTLWSLSIHPEFFRYLPKLETLIITAHRALTAIRLPPSLRLFHIFLRQPGSELEVCNLNNLRELHLYNVVTNIQLPPFLTRLTLYNTHLNLTSPDIIFHPPLRKLSFHMTRPTVTEITAWEAHQQHHKGHGRCRYDAISLEFNL